MATLHPTTTGGVWAAGNGGRCWSHFKQWGVMNYCLISISLCAQSSQSKIEIVNKSRELLGYLSLSSVPVETALGTHAAKLRPMRLSNGPANFQHSQTRSQGPGWKGWPPFKLPKALSAESHSAELINTQHGEKEHINVRPASALWEEDKSEKNAAQQHQTSWKMTALWVQTTSASSHP